MIKRTTPAQSSEGQVVKRLRDADATKRRLIDAAARQFAARGLEARIEDIAEAAGTTRAMAYYYFDSKDGLYLASLEATFLELVHTEQSIDFSRLDAAQAVATLIQAKFDHYQTHPLYLKLLAVENLNEGRFLAHSARLMELHDPQFSTFRALLEDGRRQGVFKRSPDPISLYVSIIGLGYFAFSNRYTLTRVLDTDPTSDRSVRIRRQMAVDMVLAYLRTPEE